MIGHSVLEPRYRVVRTNTWLRGHGTQNAAVHCGNGARGHEVTGHKMAPPNGRLNVIYDLNGVHTAANKAF